MAPTGFISASFFEKSYLPFHRCFPSFTSSKRQIIRYSSYFQSAAGGREKKGWGKCIALLITHATEKCRANDPGAVESIIFPPPTRAPEWPNWTRSRPFKSSGTRAGFSSICCRAERDAEQPADSLYIINSALSPDCCMHRAHTHTHAGPP